MSDRYNVGVGRVILAILAAGGLTLGAWTTFGSGGSGGAIFPASSGMAGVAGQTIIYHDSVTDRLMMNMAANGAAYALTSPSYPQIALPDVQVFSETVNVKGNCTGAQTIDLSLGNVVTATLTGDGTWTFTNPAPSGKATTASIFLTNGGAFTITWAVPPLWPGGMAPTFTASGLDIITMTTMDGGTTWYASYAQDVK